jgi:hypothetical protein
MVRSVGPVGAVCRQNVDNVNRFEYIPAGRVPSSDWYRRLDEEEPG